MSRKKLLIGFLAAVLAISLFIGIASLMLDSAVCYSGRGDKCEGECCIGNPFWCIAGPCSAFIPKM